MNKIIYIILVMFSFSSVGYSDGPVIGDHFTLTDHNNKEFNSKKHKGKYLMIFFGFTRCPDVCPLGLSKMMKVHNSLEGKKTDVIPIFITIDPENDKAVVVKQFVNAYGKSLVGLTGEDKNLDKVLKTFRGYSKKLKAKGNAQYLMEHSDIIYIMGKDGKYMKHFTSGSSIRDMSSYLNKVVWHKK